MRSSPPGEAELASDLSHFLPCPFYVEVVINGCVDPVVWESLENSKADSLGAEDELL